MDTSQLTPEGQSHRVQLDGIRAIAVLLVMVQHYFPEAYNWLQVGFIGVRVFFVLSGFLITGILLRARADAENDRASKVKVLGNFYMRRFLRIFPLFYAVLLTTEILGFPPVRASFWWHATYLSNVFLFRLGTSFGCVTHLWSLAVEEQFYILWPCLILYTPRRWVLPLVLSAIAIGPIFRAIILLNGGNAWQASILTPACLDTLGLGALLAVLSETQHQKIKKSAMRAATWIGLLIFIPTAIGAVALPSDWWVVPFGLSIGLWSMPLVDRAYVGFNGFVGRILSQGILVYLGVISYGIYVIHNFVAGVVIRILKLIGMRSPSESFLAICMALLTIALASASWQWLEKPINGMKRRFPYRVRPRSTNSPN